MTAVRRRLEAIKAGTLALLPQSLPNLSLPGSS